MKISVREITENDVDFICRYWQNATEEYMLKMGALKSKLPPYEGLKKFLMQQITADYLHKESYATIWLLNDEPVGHCNINKITFGEDAYMHLHLWENDKRHKGLAKDFIKLSLRYFFENYKLNKVCSQPYALNPAPNKALEKAGFRFIRKEFTNPGSLNFEQDVNLWEISRDDYNHSQK